MSLIKILKNIVQKKTTNEQSTTKIIKTPTPLNMHQGSIVTLSDVDIALAQADGSIIKTKPNPTYVVNAVGTYSLWGLSFYNCYLDEDNNYIRIAVDRSGKIVDASYWMLHTELYPQSVEEWEFWLGSWQKDINGKFVRDIATGKTLRKDWGLIGWNQFQIDGPPQIVYNRHWSQGPEGVDPVLYTECIIDNTGQKTLVNYEGMEYFRRLTSAADSVTEYLFATMVEDGSSINVLIGIQLDHQSLKVLAS